MEYKINDSFKIINDNSKLMLNYLKENSIDSIVCDPPYELGFMNKKWDATGIAYDVEFWKQCLKVLKPGGYLLAFGGSRTYHRMACAIEDAGFEIRDTIMWLYGSGFPKSQNVGLMVDKKLGQESKVIGKVKGVGSNNTCAMKNGLSKSQEFKSEYELKQAQNEWAGYGTCLKPAFEPIIMARKPLDGSIADNLLKYGVGAINIDECRVGDEIIGGGTMQDFRDVGKKQKEITGQDKLSFGQIENAERKENPNIAIGRFPANVITDGSDEVASAMPYTKSTGGSGEASVKSANMFFTNSGKEKTKGNNLGGLGDEGSAMRYFYCAKASKKDRDEGLSNKNIHPTVKPTELMQYLVRLITPKGGTVLDPFNGSGSTGKAVAFENRERQADYKYIGFELEKEYVDISIARINFALNQYEYEKKQEEIKTGQMSLF